MWIERYKLKRNYYHLCRLNKKVQMILYKQKCICNKLEIISRNLLINKNSKKVKKEEKKETRFTIYFD